MAASQQYGLPLCPRATWISQATINAVIKTTRARVLAEGLVVLARIRQALGDQVGAVAAVTEAERVGPSPDVVDLFNPAPAARARLQLAQGELADAAAWAAARGLHAGDPPSYPREREHLLLARVLLAQGQPEQARALLARLQAPAAAQQRTGSLIELAAVRAQVLAACGDQAGALAALAEALTLAWPEGYVRVFAVEGAPLAALLDQLIASRRRGAGLAPGVPWEYLRRLRVAFQPGKTRAITPAPTLAAPVAAGLAEPLTDRELEVLGLLAAGLANKQIARQLVVAPETAKSTSATSWASSVRPTARRRWPGPASWASSGSTTPRAATSLEVAARLSCRPLRWQGFPWFRPLRAMLTRQAAPTVKIRQQNQRQGGHDLTGGRTSYETGHDTSPLRSGDVGAGQTVR